MINNSPRSAPAASFATSKTPTAPSTSTELHRFTNPTEAAASLALREGDPSALDFYLDHGRVHVGDLAKTTADAFTLGLSTERQDSTRSCSRRPASSSPNSIGVPALTASTTRRQGERCSWPTGTRRASET